MRLNAFAVSILATAFLFAASRSVGSATDGDEKAIRSVIAEMMEDWNKHDVKSFMSHFTRDSDAVTRVGQWLRGRAKHEDHLLELHSSPFRDQLIGRNSTLPEVRFVTPDVAVAHEVVEEKTGKSIRTYVLSKKEGQWKVESDAINIIANSGNSLRPVSSGATKPNSILGKAIDALGGEERLSKIGAITWKTKGTILFGDHENKVNTQWTIQGLDHLRHEFELDFGGNTVKGINVVAGDEGWRKFGESRMELDSHAVASLKQHAYLAFVQITILPLKNPQFKAEEISEENIGGKPTAGVRAVGPDRKEFRLYFDRDSGLLLKLAANVEDFDGKEYLQETTFQNYKEIGGIKKAMKIEVKRKGERFQEHQLTEFQILDKVDPQTFAIP
jgi:uncharacterized protein (TIGR02246 family)